ncbi:MAG TPA: hypothetical protein PLF10_14390, partial [Dokdonella sp.]|nr:hypothetical protein [Dokdonella sp.]
MQRHDVIWACHGNRNAARRAPVRQSIQPDPQAYADAGSAESLPLIDSLELDGLHLHEFVA